MPATAARHRAPSRATLDDRLHDHDHDHDHEPNLDGRPGPRPTREPGSPDGAKNPLILLPAFASIGAGLVHAAVAPEHAAWLPSAAFFAALAAFQLAWGLVVLARPTRAVLGAGLVVNLGAVGLWLVSRTAGMPFGPHKAEAEPFARTDVLAAALQAALVVAALWLLFARSSGRPQTFLSVVAGGAMGAAVSGVAVVALSGAAGHAHAPGGADGHGDHGTVPVSNTTPISPRGEAPATGGAGDRVGKPDGAGQGKPAPPRADDGHAHEH